jgi:hypothetical protein
MACDIALLPAMPLPGKSLGNALFWFGYIMIVSGERPSMVTDYVERRPTSQVVLDIGDGIGALIVLAGPELLGREVEASPRDHSWLRTHTEILERRAFGKSFFAAIFPALPAGTYTIWRSEQSGDEVSIAGGAVAELDWSGAGNILLRMSRTHQYDPPNDAWPEISLEDLPPRYRDGRQANPAPMGAAPMRYTEDGLIAWNDMWTDFCDLALAGGPPHRDTVLEPADPEDVLAAPDEYARVVAEIERGLVLVTGLPTVRSNYPGWVGLQCTGDAMAHWLQRAIQVENVSVRRDGKTLYLPAGPRFRADKEIKNVVTVVAKTHHYWNEHING